MSKITPESNIETSPGTVGAAPGGDRHLPWGNDGARLPQDVAQGPHNAGMACCFVATALADHRVIPQGVDEGPARLSPPSCIPDLAT